MKTCSGIGLVIVALALGTVGAGAHGAVPDGHVSDASSSFGHPGNAKDVSRTVKIEASDFEFSPTELAFARGETIKFVVVNTSTHMHELTIGDAATQERHRRDMVKMSDMKHDKGEQDMMPSNSVHVKPGETGALIWTFAQSGKLEFACNYPGHADLGMEGKITVQ